MRNETPVESAGSTARKGSGVWRPVLLICVILALFVLSYVFNVGDKLVALRGWIQGLGAMGPVVFALIYAVSAVLALPGSAMTIIGGALFGSVLGVITVIFAATLGASLSFLIARYFARDAVGRWLSRTEKFRKLDEMTEEHGAVIVALTRLVPIFPFNLLNYGFGLTRVSFWTYVFWSFICMLPGTILYVVGADALFSGIAEGKIPWTLIIILAVMIVIVTMIVRRAKRHLNQKGPGSQTT